jgi:hypothetical protein
MYNGPCKKDPSLDDPHFPKPGMLRRTFSGIFIDLQGLPVSLKILTLLGYLAVFGQLIFTLLVELAGDRLQTVTYTLAQQTNQIPLIVMVVTGLAFILGWAFLLSGAAAARARIFLPILALFGLQLFLATNGNLLLIFLEAVFLFLTLLVYGLTFRKHFWHDFPGLHFFVWLAAVSFFILLSVGTATAAAGFATTLASNFSIVLMLTLAFWVVLGLSTFDLGIRIGRSLARLGRRVLPLPAFSALTVFVLLVHPAVSALVFWLAQDGYWFLDLLFSFVLVLGALVVWLSRRWSGSSCAVLLCLSLASPVVILGISMAFVGQDFTQLLLQLTGIFPPTLLFVSLTTYNLLGMGVTFSNVDGRILPRRARLLLYFGTLILVVACMLFLSNVRDAATNQVQEIQGLINNLYALSAFYLGIPYLVWMLWKKREILTGPETAFKDPPRWSWLERLPAPVWFTLSLVFACSMICVVLIILYKLI